jgi:clan AA aspartic protease
VALTHLDITVSNPADSKKQATIKFLIDSGAIYSVVPSSTLKKVGIKPEEKRKFTLANGQDITRSLGIARFKYNGHTGGAPVIFGQSKDTPLLGATTLESLGMALNPLTRQLMPLPMVLG